MQVHSSSPLALIRSLSANRTLVRALVRREVLGRYRGSMFGVLWSFFNPLLMLAIYTFVFSIIFKARWTPSESKAEFALALFIGLIAFNIFAECVNRAPTLILNNVNYVKRVVFPLEVLPVISVGAALFHAVISLCAWFLFFVVARGVPYATILWLPIVIAPLVFITAGMSWLIAAMGVYLRDIGQVAGLATSALLFVSPVFYPLSVLPPKLQTLFQLNPLTYCIEMLRDVLMWGRSPGSERLLISYIFGIVVLLGGFALFQKTRKGFADVL
jgi:lipopolysaccharide transport system permease protein